MFNKLRELVKTMAPKHVYKLKTTNAQVKEHCIHKIKMDLKCSISFDDRFLILLNNIGLDNLCHVSFLILAKFAYLIGYNWLYF